ncbi:hypothetical protein N7456_004520 [Penicillium angulare]|uniref:Uncharacterized protein n=1 Tax=Penicillium angulare TaxID=116970 RepID=A0A9W9FWP6_9EURO|nr:hypothetical protein N7456_004520 [Penicillium angulare]
MFDFVHNVIPGAMPNAPTDALANIPTPLPVPSKGIPKGEIIHAAPILRQSPLRYDFAGGFEIAPQYLPPGGMVNPEGASGGLFPAEEQRRLREFREAQAREAQAGEGGE